MDGKLEVVIAGAGVAGLEAAFALQALAAKQVNVTIVSAQAEFVLRPMAVLDPFSAGPPEAYPLSEMAAGAGAELIRDSFRWLDGPNRVMHTRGGREVRYDVLVLALGARSRSHFRFATTLRLSKAHEQLAELTAEVQEGTVARVAVLVPSRVGWPLPLYQLCLLLAGRARAAGRGLELTLATAEEEPLEWFGADAAHAVGGMFNKAGIELITGVSCEVPEAGRVSLRPGLTEIEADRIVSMPLLYGPSTPGLPKRARSGFISVDTRCRVRGLPAVFAAGDATDFPVKGGAVAGQQADAVATRIAAAAGAGVRAEPFQPVIHGVLRQGRKPLYLTSHLLGSHSHHAEVGEAAHEQHPATLAARYLASYLESRSHAAAP